MKTIGRIKCKEGFEHPYITHSGTCNKWGMWIASEVKNSHNSKYG